MNNKSFGGLASSIFALFCTTMFLQTSFIPNIVSESLASTDTVRSTSYGKTFPALNTLEDLDGQKVIAIGSSIIQYSVDGKCISDTITISDTLVFNLGVSGANPYTEILQIPAIIRVDPEIVMIDLGPNGLWDFYESESLDEYIRSNAETAYHPCGTLKMGVDKMAVVDENLKIYGLQNIRVVDASVIPEIPSANLNAPTLMIAEKASDAILSD